LLGAQQPILFISNACAYSLFAVIIALWLRGERWNIAHIAWAQLIVDITCITIAAHATGGVGSGLEALLVVFVVASGMMLPGSGSYLAAALGALAVLAEQTLSFLQGVTNAAAFLPAGVTGAIMLMFTIAVQPFVRRAAETEALARQRGIDLRNLAQLNNYIIQNLREAILVIDERREIRLTNQAAAEQLGLPKLQPGEHLSKASPEIFGLLRAWQENDSNTPGETASFLAADQATTINVYFVPLGNRKNSGPVLIFLEDASLFTEKVQQSKLAALGRLSASIAHEIRNPVGALSHAAQLLRESPGLGPQDTRFVEIIQTNAQRVSDIVENILQLSRKEAAKPQRLALGDWAREFVREFVSTLELFEGQVRIVDSQDVDVRMDPGHLHQVTWNLCENAVKYASEAAGAIAVEMRFGRLPSNGRPFLEIADHGPGIPESIGDTLFEPFATGSPRGTGLGLYICRELCECNGGTLRYRPRESGGSVFQIVFADPERWEI
jgi:two-component system sensor histidine kinase PilS (NtrC family)